eukprot:Blabericola_migrator_1__11231@NODE_65_length_15685_cov_31_404533_g58_i0_p4_GENE_NODE_65_length_15685_cov_31_404533_g58_i0NODE_65_length_15685_cov_31_404533_g58_i0_p4_ORF_typecomplete_len749_score77_80PDEase_I/PF00233_19/4_2e03PDEase_I/PF00233_19/0_48_NODE_65_length_15685_cov_31_404533_g58_i024164662
MKKQLLSLVCKMAMQLEEQHPIEDGSTATSQCSKQSGNLGLGVQDAEEFGSKKTHRLHEEKMVSIPSASTSYSSPVSVGEAHPSSSTTLLYSPRHKSNPQVSREPERATRNGMADARPGIFRKGHVKNQRTCFRLPGEEATMNAVSNKSGLKSSTIASGTSRSSTPGILMGNAIDSCDDASLEGVMLSTRRKAGPSRSLPPPAIVSHEPIATTSSMGRMWRRSGSGLSSSYMISMDKCHGGRMSLDYNHGFRNVYRAESNKRLFKSDNNGFAADDHFWSLVTRWPLGFRRKRLERVYVEVVAAGCEFRTRIAGLILLLVSSALWLTYGSMSFPHLIGRATDVLILIWNIGNACLLLSGGVTVSMAQVTFLTQRRELMLATLTMPIFVFWICWTAACFIVQKYLPSSGILDAVELKYYTDPVMVFLFFTSLIILDHLLHFRVKWSQAAAAILFSFYAVNRVLQAWSFSSSQNVQLGDLVVFEICQCVFMLIVLLFSLAGQHHREVYERVAFVAVEEDQKRLQSLREAHKRRRVLGGETVLEGLIHELRQASVELQTATFSHSNNGDPRLIECDEILHQCIECLLNVDSGQHHHFPLTVNASGPPLKSHGSGPTGIDMTVAEIAQPDYFTPDLMPSFTLTGDERTQVGNNPNLDVLTLWSTNSHILVEFGVALLEPYITTPMKSTESTLIKYLLQLENKYYFNPYHNACHGATVAHMFTCLVRTLDYTSIFGTQSDAFRVGKCNPGLRCA